MATASATQNGPADPVAELGEELIRDSRLHAGYWPWLAGILLLAWLVTTGLWLKARSSGRARVVSESQPPENAPSPAKALVRIQQACRANDSRAARQALLDWAEARWRNDPPRRLETLAQRIGGQATEVLRELDRCLFAGDEQTWDGATAWSRLSPLLSEEKGEGASGRQESALPPLYPQSV